MTFSFMGHFQFFLDYVFPCSMVGRVEDEEKGETEEAVRGT